MLSDITPFRLAGNIFFVGTYKESSHLIDTGDGLILIDVGFEQNADIVVDSMNMLGYSASDIKIILLSHGHSDHSAGAKKIADISGATICMFEEDIRYLKGKFVPDHFFKDGETISLGNTEILCLHTPGHTAGTASFFFNVNIDGQTYRAGTFGGASANQLRKPFLDAHDIPYRMRGIFLDSIESLQSEHVDIFLGNHSWQNKTRENAEILKQTGKNPFIDSSKWLEFLKSCENHLASVIDEEKKTMFVNYAHRGASAYMPENTLLSFYTGISMNANGIETDVRRTRDGKLVLFHDNTLDRMAGVSGSVSDYTYDELRAFDISRDGYSDKIVSLETFLECFSFRDVTFAIELKDSDIEVDVANMLRKYNMSRKTVVTSFEFDLIKKFKEVAPEFRVGHLCSEVDEALERRLIDIGADEICPKASTLTAENIDKWHKLGFRVRAWGVSDESLMRTVYDLGADGMTVNFPDKLHQYIREKENASEEKSSDKS